MNRPEIRCADDTIKGGSRYIAPAAPAAIQAERQRLADQKRARKAERLARGMK